MFYHIVRLMPDAEMLISDGNTPSSQLFDSLSVGTILKVNPPKNYTKLFSHYYHANNSDEFFQELSLERLKVLKYINVHQ